MAGPEDFDEDQLEHLMQEDEEIPELDLGEEIARSSRVIGEETVDSGVRRRPRDVANMGFGAEPHDADELADATIGRDLRGRRGVTREDEAHAQDFLDDENGGSPARRITDDIDLDERRPGP